MNGFNINDLSEGQRFDFEKTILPQDIDDYAMVSGDTNPLHADSAFAKSRGFSGRVVHGFLIASYISRLVGVHCPGETALLQTVSLKFLKPVYEGEKVRVCAIVDQISLGTKTVVLKVHVENPRNSQVHVRGKVQVGFTHDLCPK